VASVGNLQSITAALAKILLFSVFDNLTKQTRCTSVYQVTANTKLFAGGVCSGKSWWKNLKQDGKH
jgi:hypothetical protein